MFLVKFQFLNSTNWEVLTSKDFLPFIYKNEGVHKTDSYTRIAVDCIEDWTLAAPHIVFASQKEAHKAFRFMLLNYGKLMLSKLVLVELANYEPYRPYQVLQYWENK